MESYTANKTLFPLQEHTLCDINDEKRVIQFFIMVAHHLSKMLHFLESLSCEKAFFILFETKGENQ